MGEPRYRGPVWGSLPSDYPTTKAENVYRFLLDQMPGDSRYRRLMGFGFKGAAYRYKAFTEYDDVHTESIAAYGITPTEDIAFKQEHALFGFFVSGLSSLECFFFGLHAVGGYFASDLFDIASDSLRLVKLKSVTDKFEEQWPESAVALASRSLLDSDVYARWNRIRNAVIHRAVPPRAITISPGQSAISVWLVEETGFDDANETINEATTVPWHNWLSEQLNVLWSSLDTFSTEVISEDTKDNAG